MKEKKLEITEEEYENIKREIKEILKMKEELKLAVEVQRYQSHIPLAGNFAELSINLMRNNHDIEEEIDRAIKEFIKTLYANKSIKKEINKVIRAQKEILETKKELENQETPAEFISIAAHYPEFQSVYLLIQDGINKKIANNYLLEQVDKLQEKYDVLSIKKAQYEKQEQKKEKRRTFRKFTK